MMRLARPAALAATLAAATPVHAQSTALSSGSRTLVMPFASDRADSRAFWLGEAAAVLLAEDLRALGVEAITRDERREAFERLQVPASAVLTDATVIRIGQLVGARQAIIGSLTLEGEEMVVTARNIALDAARIDATASARGSLAALFGVIERLARALVPPPASSAPLDREYPPVAAFELYIKGLLAETPVYAVNYLQNAIKQAPAFDRARLALWDVYNTLADHERALAVVLPVGVDPGPPWGRRARFDAGLSQLGLERYDEALATFTRLADAEPTAAVLNNLGVVSLRRDPTAPGAAVSYFERAAAADPEDPDYRFNAGYALWRAGDAARAVESLREAVRRDPADADAHIVLSAALLAIGNAAEAGRERELAGRLSSDYELAAATADRLVPDGLERIRGAVELPRELTIEAALESSDAREQRALAAEYLQQARGLFEEERDREAAAALNRVLFIAPYDAEAHLLLGRLHLRNGRARVAADALKISLWSRETAEAHVVLAQAYLELKDRAAAVSEAERALALDPTLEAAEEVLDQAGDLP